MSQREHGWLARAILVMVAVTGAVLALTIWSLYRTAMDVERARLTALVSSQANLLESVARFDRKHSPNHPGGPGLATIGQMIDAQKGGGFGRTGEFTLARRKDDGIFFLFRQRARPGEYPATVPYQSDLAEPMRRALEGNSGTVSALDYRGVKVLAAHVPLTNLDAGLVAKIDLAELRAPFIKAIAISVGGALVLVLIGVLLFRRMSAPLMEREAALAEVRKLSRALDQSPLMVLITDRHGIIEYVNTRFTDMTGYEAQEVLGKNPAMLRSDHTPPGLYTDMFGALLSGGLWNGDVIDRRKDGTEFWARVTAAPVKNGAGTVTHFVAIHEDITRQHEVQAHLAAEKRRADIANRAKSELLANMSHELRTPLNAIIGFSGTLKDGVFGPLANDKQAEYVGDIHASGEHLLELINDILDVSAIEAGKIELHEEALDVPAVCRASLRLIEPRAQTGKVRLGTEIDEDLPSLWADERRLKQILINLLSNAVKFTPPDGQVVLSSSKEGGGGVRLSVRDTGIGMDGDELEKAMRPFGQIESSLSRRHEGTGLGLPLARGLVELHNGSLVVESEPGRGTCVTVVFPAARSRAPEPAPEPEPAAE